MTLQNGGRLGPYEITGPLGAGGMGEVYRARDTRLERNVAIKVLPADFAGNADLKARFEREARTISQLNHPNICTLYDIGHEGGVDYLVMELLEGETLADRLSKGPLPLAEVLRYGAQIADALARAHRQAITHRDLKPGNVMLTKSGAKLLDFGLAKTLTPARPASAPHDATEHRPLTQEGTILGTFQYMAPEQLAGEEADGRTDIFALGAVLYEMTTGAPAFTGKNRTSLVANILSVNPRPISELQPLTPPSLERLIQRCLAKDPDERWQSAHDIAEELKWIGEAGSHPGVPAPVTRRRVRARTMVTAIVAAVIGAAIGVATTWFAIESRRTALRVAISMPDALRIVGSRAGGGVALAPDGLSVVFVGLSGSDSQRLFVRALNDFVPRALPLTEGATYPFWSPDGRAVAFFSGGKLKRVDLSGAPPVTLADAADGRGGTWGKGGVIVYAPGPTSPLLAVSASGGTAGPATQPVPNDHGHRFPSFFPDGDHFLYFTQGGAAVKGIWVSSLSSGRAVRLLQTRLAAVAAGKNEILYVRDGVLLAQRVDLGKLAVTGEARPISQNVSSSSYRNIQLLSASAAMAVFQTGSADRSVFTWFDRSGRNLAAVGPADEYEEPTFSANESKVVVSLSDGKGLSEVDLSSGRLSRMTFSDSSTVAAAMDGSRVIYADNSKIALMEIVPGKPERILGQFKKPKYPDYFDRTGEIFLADGEREDGRGDSDIFEGRRSTGFKLEPLLDGPANETHAQLSPDGKFVAYSSDESGHSEVFVQPIPPTGQKWLISTSGGDQAQWRADGKELFYLAPDAKIMSVPIRNHTPFETGDVAVLFTTHIAPASVLGSRNQYLVASDGQRFLVLEPVPSPHSNELSVITDWKR